IREAFDLRPKGIIDMLSLKRPIYQATAAYGHFGRQPSGGGTFSWEKTDKAEQLAKLATQSTVAVHSTGSPKARKTPLTQRAFLLVGSEGASDFVIPAKRSASRNPVVLEL